ncbi:hypothetical protein KP509_34G073600 [Ceratopteris richardii]|nr:hypothetical protein KP509_34G073600 [Ceratopteris richardii]
MTTSYDYDAPIDEYGLFNQPKWGHLKGLHQALKLCELALIDGARSDPISLGNHQYALVFSNGTDYCAAFITNLHTKRSCIVEYNGQKYNLPAQSISILIDCKTEVFNTAKVYSQTNTIQMLPALPSSLETVTKDYVPHILGIQSWQWFAELVGEWDQTYTTSTCCSEQIHLTKDTTDYLWYITSINIAEEDVVDANLHLQSVAHAAHIFINEEYTGTAAGDRVNPVIEIDQPVKLKSGQNDIAILSMTVGLQSGVRPGHIQLLGIQGPVTLGGLSVGDLNLTSQSWTYQVGLQGEYLQLFNQNDSNNEIWNSSSLPVNRSLTWYKTTFDAPESKTPLALDLSTMGKGQAWINGKSIGRYWPSRKINGDNCSFSPEANEIEMIQSNVCAESTQRWYHVPLSLIKSTGNLLVLFEEVGGDPTGITLVTRALTAICSRISEDFPAPLESWQANSTLRLPEMRLECSDEQKISSIHFASFGNPRGNCNKFRRGPCHAESSPKIVKEACIGRQNCTVAVTASTFGADPCPDEIKALAVMANCSSNPSSAVS